MIALYIMAVILQSKCYQMSNQVPNLPVSIDVHLMNIKTVSWLSFFSRSVLLSLQHALYTRSAEQISRSDASGHLIKWTHFHQNIMEITWKFHEKLSNAAGVDINHLIIMQWFNHILV